jgi:hypothetical protein
VWRVDAALERDAHGRTALRVGWLAPTSSLPLDLESRKDPVPS